MATEERFVEYVRTQTGLGTALTYKKMFGEYALYLDGKVVGFACDNQLYVKPTDEGRAFLGTVSEHPPYPGAKNYFRIADEMEDRERLGPLLVTTAKVLPMPKAKARKEKPANRGK